MVVIPAGHDAGSANGNILDETAMRSDVIVVGANTSTGAGNIHSRKQKWNEVTPLVMHLVGAKLPVKTHDVSAAGGTFWACMAVGDGEPTCGENPMSADPKSGTPWTLGPPRDESHDGVYYVGKTTAAFPARPK